MVAILVALALLLAAALVYGRHADGKDTGSETETRISEICSAVDGVGECRVIVNFEPGTGEEEGRVYSVAVICEGADDVNVRARITGLITSLYGIGSNRVSVVRLEK